MTEWSIAPRILNLGTRWRYVVSFTSRPLYPRGKSPKYPQVRRLGGTRVFKPRRIWAEHVARIGQMRNIYKIFVEKPEGKRPIGRPKRRWENIKTDLRHIGWEIVKWLNLTQDRYH
jgi:hypothetical protein